MSRNSMRNRLHTDGLIFRELEVGGESGFVLRVMDRTIKPPKVTTIVQQPGQDSVATESLLFVTDRIDPPGGGQSRFAPPEPTETENPDRIVELLQLNRNPLAEIALQHLLANLEATENSSRPIQ